MASDEEVDERSFSGLHIKRLEKDTTQAPFDLFALAACDVVIGSNSTFGDWVAWYGDIPHIIMSAQMDWEYYTGRTSFFENKYCTLVHY